MPLVKRAACLPRRSRRRQVSDRSVWGNSPSTASVAVIVHRQGTPASWFACHAPCAAEVGRRRRGTTTVHDCFAPPRPPPRPRPRPRPRRATVEHRGRSSTLVPLGVLAVTFSTKLATKLARQPSLEGRPPCRPGGASAPVDNGTYRTVQRGGHIRAGLLNPHQPRLAAAASSLKAALHPVNPVIEAPAKREILP